MYLAYKSLPTRISKEGLIIGVSNVDVYTGRMASQFELKAFIIQITTN